MQTSQQQPPPPQHGGAVHVHAGGASGGYAMQIDSDQTAPAPPGAGVPLQYQQAVQFHQPQPVALHGQWRDNLFDCFGVDGPSSCCMACIFPMCTPCLMAKISSRISWVVPWLHCWGPTAFTQWLRFTGVLAFLYIFCTFNASVFHSMGMEEYNKDVAKSPWHDQDYAGVRVSQETRELFGWAAVFDMGTWVVSLVFVFLMALLRQRVRQRFLIPTICENRAGENRFCGVVEDVLCMTTCWACSLAQIARHTFALVQSDRCDPWTDPGPIESFPVMHAAPASVNSMQPQMQTVAQYVPPAPPGYYTPDNMQMAPPARGQVVEVGQLVPGSFPAPASTGAVGVPTATVSQHGQQPEVPLAQHVPEVPQGVSRSDAKV